MYESFFGLTERPFELTANPRYVFLTPRHREALGMLQYGLAARKGIIVLTGEAGTGKTTMVTVALAQLGVGHLVAYVNNPTLSRAEFVELMTARLGLPPEVAASKVKFLAAVEALLAERAAHGQVTAIVIDEAHSLPHELLEEIRLLANIERPDQKLLTVVLVGQPELAERLNQPDLRQLKQRVALRCQLTALSLRETAAYVAKRIRLAGGDSMRILTRDAVQAIYEYSGGIPRTINVICDNACVSAFAQDQRPVSRQIVLDVCRDFDLPRLADAGAPSSSSGGSTTEVPAAPAVVASPPAVQAAIEPRHPVLANRPADAPTRSPGTLLDLRPVAAGVRPDDAAHEHESNRSFWSSLRFWRR